ncbi:MAG: alpha-2-macroglobulin, partial [Saprospiraceae bacterium]
SNVYPLTVATSTAAPTGNWLAKVKVGGAIFSKSIKVETVKPNRLKIKMDVGRAQIMAKDGNLNCDLQVNWLHGAPAQNVAVKIEKQVRAVNTTFKKYKEYEFDDPARTIDAEPQVVFDGKVNQAGNANVTIKRNQGKLFPGMLATSFNIRAFEKGGDFSADQFTIKESPYDTYTGIYIKKNKYGEKRLDIGKSNSLEFIAVDENGNPAAGRNLKIGLYRMNWRWWWDRGNDNISQYNSAKHYGSVESASVRTNGKGEVDWNVNIADWGRYLVRVCDNESGHCSGDIFYAGNPWNDGESNQNRDAASMLAFAADKNKYEVGDVVELTIPSSGDGRALISIENGSRIVESYWTNTTNGETKFSFYATKEMTPTVYANISLIQPHAQVKNDLPIRLYGVIPINIEDEATRLNPELKMPDVLEPEQTVTVQVSEDKGKSMAYTIAMVDEGLLDLTRFGTPNPWNSFYAREALGVKTWDVYDHVLGAYGGELERVLAIGGDAELRKSKDNQEANRFKPVVKHLGPFFLEKGSTAKHQITVPNYVGSVRTMVVASNNGAYGSSEKTTAVRKPLMVLATLPRVLGPTEELTLPVTVFAMEQKIKNVKVTIEETSGLVNVIGGNSQNLTFTKPGEALVNFNIKVADGVGVAKFKITATGAGESATQAIEIQVRNPNPFVTNVVEKVLQPGENWSTGFEAVGVTGTNEGMLEVSNIPPIDLGKRLNYLIRYPHGCIEQTTSSGFPQLFVSKLMEIEDSKKQQIARNITATINRLKQFQTANGGFGYWPGDNYASTWGTNYAGHFMLEAQKLGYSLPTSLLSQWKRYQKKQAQNWNYGDNRYDNELTQAYRLYTLALAGAPEIGAMNRLREHGNISDQAKWRLAAAYAEIGKPEVATVLVKALKTTVKDYRELSYTYGSGLRDEAMILETLVGMEKMDKAGSIAKKISKQLSSGSWYGTQTVAYSLLAIGKFVGNTAVGDQFKFAYQVGDAASVNAGSSTPMMSVAVPVDGNANKSVRLTNNSNGVLYVNLITTGQPLIGDQTAKAENLKMKVKYLDNEGNSIDVSRLAQGTDFVAQVSITNPGTKGIRYEEMALTQIFPSGWEILNTRMTNVERFADSNKPEYQDIRDDRVYSYFDINRKAKQTYTIQLNAAYEGRYYLPTVSCEAMYDNTIQARQPGEWVEVVKTNSL